MASVLEMATALPGREPGFNTNPILRPPMARSLHGTTIKRFIPEPPDVKEAKYQALLKGSQPRLQDRARLNKRTAEIKQYDTNDEIFTEISDELTKQISTLSANKSLRKSLIDEVTSTRKGMGRSSRIVIGPMTPQNERLYDVLLDRERFLKNKILGLTQNIKPTLKNAVNLPDLNYDDFVDVGAIGGFRKTYRRNKRSNRKSMRR